MPSIGDSQRAAGGNNLYYYQKVRQNNALLGQHYPLHIKEAYAYQAPDHLYYGKYLATEPPYGLRQVNQTGFGLFNGGGVLLPPPRPGSHIVTGEIGQSVSVRLGEVYKHGGVGEVGPQATQQYTGIPVISAPWIAPSAANPDSFSVISYIPIGTAEFPANQTVFENKTATNYSVSIGSSVVSTNLTSQVQQGTLATTTDRLLGEINLEEAKENYEGYLLTDPNQTAEPLSTDPALPPIVETEFNPMWLDKLEGLLDLPIGSEAYRQAVYCSLQKLAEEAWSGTGDNPIEDLQASLGLDSSNEEITKVVKQVNKWLPTALKVKDLIFTGTKSNLTVGNTGLDLQTLDVTIDLNQSIDLLNKYLKPSIQLTDSVLTVCDIQIKADQVYEVMPAEVLSCLRRLDAQLPTDLKFKTYGTDRVTAVRIAPGIYISEGQALRLQNKVGNPIEIAIDGLKCHLPAETNELLNLQYADKELKSQPINTKTFLDSLKQLMGFISDPVAAVNRLTQQLPGELKNFIIFTGEEFGVNPEAFLSFGINTINEQLPSQLQLSVDIENNRLTGAQLGPIKASIGNGVVNLGINPNNLVGGLKLAGSIPAIPSDKIRQVLDKVDLDLSFPYNTINVDESEGSEDAQTINQGGYVQSIRDLNLTNLVKGSPMPLILATLDCLAPLSQSSSPETVTPQLDYFESNLASPYCYAEELERQAELSQVVEDIIAVNPVYNTINLADSTTYPTIMTKLLESKLTPTEPVINSTEYDYLYGTPAGSEFANYLENLGVTNAQYILDKIAQLEQSNSMVPLIELLASVSSTPTQNQLNQTLNELYPVELALCTAPTYTITNPLSLSSIVDNPGYLVDWIRAVEPRLTNVVETLVYGELYDFFVNLVLILTKGKVYIPNSPKANVQLQNYIANYFDIPN
jgi:hypothetical protein